MLRFIGGHDATGFRSVQGRLHASLNLHVLMLPFGLGNRHHVGQFHRLGLRFLDRNRRGGLGGEFFPHLLLPEQPPRARQTGKGDDCEKAKRGRAASRIGKRGHA